VSNKRAAHTAQGERATEIERERDLLEEEEGDEQAKELTTEAGKVMNVTTGVHHG